MIECQTCGVDRIELVEVQDEDGVPVFMCEDCAWFWTGEFTPADHRGAGL